MTRIPAIKIRLDEIHGNVATFSLQLRGEEDWHFMTFNLVPGQKLIFTDGQELTVHSRPVKYSHSKRSPENDQRFSDGFGQAVDNYDNISIETIEQEKEQNNES